ncbi:hypothetical protein FNJ87_00115 [Nonlabens mediterrranea]|uniref:Uncharacterized protein n=1 Tax=Nonlabens mediterrranea TaxID=1419947 RepID=A0ABS0A1U3_9FLAO|nr:hypothetical protein [Nonlabens mediterrranea]
MIENHVSGFFTIPEPPEGFEFVDVNVYSDRRLFLNPQLIEISSSPYARSMRNILKHYWGAFFMHARKADKLRAIAMLSGLSEPTETRIGYATGCQGNSVGFKLQEVLWDTIVKSKAVKSGVLTNFNNLSLFTEGIGADRISDITTKICKVQLIEFTQYICERYDVEMKLVRQKDLFNPMTFKWESRDVYLPVIDGKPLILIPRDMVSSDSVINGDAIAFYRFAIRNVISQQLELKQLIKGSGKVNNKVLLRDWYQKHPFSKDVLADWSLHYPKLLIDFEELRKHSKLRPLSSHELREILYLPIRKVS